MRSIREFEEKRFIEIENDTIYFCDPVAGTRVSDGEVPRSLWEDEIFREGGSALGRLAQKGVVIDIVLNLHGGREDFERLQEFRGLLDYKLVGMEWGSAVKSMYPRTKEEVAFDNFTDGGNGMYVTLAKEWLEGEGISTAPSDINTHATVGGKIIPRPGMDSDPLRSRLIELWSPAMDAGKKEDDGKPETATTEEWERYWLAWTAYQYSRQYLLLGHFGYMAALHEQELEPGDKIGLVIGSGHTVGVPRKANQVGVSVNPHVLQSPTNKLVKREMFRKAMPDGRMSIDGLTRLVEQSKRNTHIGK
jgi:hypothetical protein